MGLASTIYKLMKVMMVHWEFTPFPQCIYLWYPSGLIRGCEKGSDENTWVFIGKRMPYGSASIHPHLTGFCEPPEVPSFRLCLAT